MTGKLEYLNRAKEALEFMYEHAWDNEHGGWFNSLDRDGNPNNINQNKTAFYQHYALLGIAAYYEATRRYISSQLADEGLSKQRR